jgi:outer membrane protein assembly factor BamA
MRLQTRSAWLLLLAFVASAVVAQDLGGDPPLVIEDLQCRGNTTTSCSFILGQVYLLPGERIDEEEIRNAKLRLSSLSNFRAVDIYLDRLWDFSYIVAGYDYYPTSRIVTRELEDDGTYTTEEREVNHGAVLSYGWNSEDDYYFPTRGSAFVTGLALRFADGGETFGNLLIQFRKTWQTKGGSLWTVKFGGEPRTEFRTALNEGQLNTVTFARPLSPDNKLGIERGRW